MNAYGAGHVVLAHAGGLPEAAMVGAPLLALVVFVVLERRARRREQSHDDEEDRR